MSHLYGSALYGSITYGSDTITEPLFGLTVDWEKLGYFTGRNEARRMQDFVIRRGRKHYITTSGDGFEHEDVGTMVATIADPDREFVPWNISSPLYGKVGSNRRFHMGVVTPDAVAHDLMRGNVSKVIPLDGVIPSVRIEAVDGWELLQGQKANITVPLQENIYADEVIPLILAKAGWPSDWGHDLEAGRDLQPYWWVDRRNAADAIFDIVHSELGKAFIKASGELAFRSRYFMEDPIRTITDADFDPDSLDVISPWEIQRNVVTLYVRPRTLKDSQTLWSLPQVTPINAGQTLEFYPEFLYNGVIVPAKDILVAATANTLESGGGTDLSSSLVVTQEPLGNQIKATVYNGSGSNGFLLTTTVSGKPIVNDASVPLRAQSILANEDVLEFLLDTPWIQNIQSANSYKDFLLEFLVQAKQYVTFTLNPDPNSQFVLDLGRHVRLNSARLGVDANYSIAHLEHHYWRQRNHTLTTVFLEPVPDLTSYWQFGVSAFGITTKFAP